MDRVHFSKRGMHPESSVETYVGALIMTCGYRAIIYDLVSAVHHLARASLANPQDIATHRDFTLWANAVRAAILKHGDLSAFKDRLNDFDKSLATQMGISLD